MRSTDLPLKQALIPTLALEMFYLPAALWRQQERKQVWTKHIPCVVSHPPMLGATSDKTLAIMLRAALLQHARYPTIGLKLTHELKRAVVLKFDFLAWAAD